MFGFKKRSKSALEQYRETRDKRSEALRGNRRQALRHVCAEFPDAKVLITENAKSFVGYSASSKKIFTGKFIDLPELANPGINASEEAYADAVERFRDQRKIIDEFISMGGTYSGMRYRDLWYTPVETLQRGFDYVVYDSRRAAEAKLLCNGTSLWERYFDTGRDLNELRRVLDRNWYASNDISGQTAFRLTVEIGLYGFSTGEVAAFDCLFLGGPPMTGRAKEQFSSTVIEPIYDFIAATPIWGGNLDQFIDMLGAIEIDDEWRI